MLAPIGIAAVTGSVLVFREPLDRVVNPRLHVVRPAGARLALDRVVAIVESRFAGARVGTITLPSRADGSLIAYLPGRDVFIDPYSGDILGERFGGRIAFDRAYLIPILVRLHYTLLLKASGAWVMGVAAVVWFWTTLAGHAIAAPASWRSAAAWRYAIQLRAPQGLWIATWDLHRAIGLVLLPMWLMLAATSMYLAFPSGFRALVSTMAPVAAVPIPKSTWRSGPAVSFDLAVSQALAAVQGARAFGVTRDFTNHRYSVRLVLDGDRNPAGNSQVYVDFGNGQVLAVRLATEAPAGLRFLYWQFPLHSGKAFGRAGQMAIALSGLAIGVLAMSGLYLWRRGLRARHTSTRHSQDIRQ
jgi:uncharacterized iron-regulated membrane protein